MIYKRIKKGASISGLILLIVFNVSGQQTDSAKEEKCNLHFQLTMIGQYHPAFNAKYTGINSIQPNSESSESLTTTFFYDTRLWKGSQFILNPEVAGGTGLSKVLGIAGALNGETY